MEEPSKDIQHGVVEDTSSGDSEPAFTNVESSNPASSAEEIGTACSKSIHSDSDPEYSPSEATDSDSSSTRSERLIPSSDEDLDVIAGSEKLIDPSNTVAPLYTAASLNAPMEFPYPDCSDDDEEHEDCPDLGVSYSRDLADFANSYPAPSTRPRVSASNNPPAPSSDVTPKRIRGKVYCFYCEEEVLQFARHIERHHYGEVDVQRILSLAKQSKERKRLLYAIRTKGNYLLSKQTGRDKPVRTPITQRESTQPLPCKHCYGFFARKHLWRHMRTCPCKPGSSTENKGSRLNMAQNMTLSQVYGNEYLHSIVFPRMQADEVTRAVKGDPLICAFGSRFAKIHQEKHQVNLVSRKMREMGKLLNQLNLDSDHPKGLIDLLKPQNYDNIVEAVKRIAKYDPAKREFGSPCLASNISTSIKDCCEIACNFLNKRGTHDNKHDQDVAEFPFRSLISLIKSDWKFDISHNANNDRARASMNKITIVPLARDLRKFRDYLIETGDEAYQKLEADPNDEVAFKHLVESVYCRVMLLCRKRCGELARLPLELYIKSGDRQSYEEFSDVLTPAELILARRFRRLLVVGKRRPTAVLFSEGVQRHIAMLLTVREHFVSRSNEYLFATGPGIGTLIGHRVITKLAGRADLVRPEAITTRALRKHLATVCQVLAMTDQDIEQLATFMGHTGWIHRSEYRLPDSIFQTAKVSKLLLMMESGDAAKYKGKTLDEIDVDMEADLLMEPETTVHFEDDINAIDCTAPSTSIPTVDEQPDINAPVPSTSTDIHVTAPCELSEGVRKAQRDISFDGITTSTPRKKGKKPQIHVRWTEQEKRVVKTFFARHIQKRKAPKRLECEHLISTHDVLRDRPWTKIKGFVVNEYSKKRQL